MLSEDEFKVYLLDKYVDETGRKLSVRSIWNTEEFMEHTGMFKLNKYTGSRERVSEGTISYYNKKLNLTEADIFEYHQNITKRIQPTVTFEEWSRKNNKGYTREQINNRETIKSKMIDYFKLSDTYVHYSHDKVRELADRLLGKEAVTKFYQLVEAGEI